ncbi:unnamed protein product [Linum tenue]|uniref:Bifunctional inhibitor/plant lipid transfer protein/seed storage helical domain-containing protein n=1 Tax=Linum tenue TaxID=586396 RepID=A0AAV0HWX9_9ROSI|nr:unnamed protein product [Linum tenue]
MAQNRNMTLVCLTVTSLAIAAATAATLQDAETECAEHLTDLAACIPYVSGTAKKPTPECCQDAKKLKDTEPKCLCVLIKESTDPSMGLPINTTLALQMPSACNIDAKVSNCPTLLNISPDSQDAKIFKEAGDSDSSSSTGSSSSTKDSPASSATTSPSTSTDSSSKTDSKASPTTSSNDGQKMKVILGGWTLMALAASMFF